MFKIGISGGIGSGKSSVAALLHEAGIRVLDADLLSHRVTAPGGAAVPEILEAFGPELLNADGQLDRQRLADIVFHDKKKLDRLSRIIHKYVLEQMHLAMDEAQQAACPVIALDVPIPVQHGFRDRIDQLWIVDAEDELRLERLQQRGLSESDARRRMASQLTREDFQDMADRWIDNSGSPEDLRARVASLLAAELGGRGIPYRDILNPPETALD